jgi:hypothetical protein
MFSITYSRPVVPFCPKLVQNKFSRWLPEFASLYNRIPEGNRGGTFVNSFTRPTTIIKNWRI